MHLITAKTLQSRRHFLHKLAATGAFFTVPGLYAEALTLTPRVTQGPFYPMAKNIPLDKDNDLVVFDDTLTPAHGLVTYVSGRVLDSSGSPIRNALVELWHADNGGEYTYSANEVRNPRADAHFAGFGQTVTDKDGGFKFRTVKAGLYPDRTRHFHFGVTLPGQKMRTTTQLFWNEVAKDANGRVWQTTNENDNVLSTIRDPALRKALLGDFKPVPGGVAGEEATTWDIVMGVTPAEPTYPNTDGGNVLIAAVPVSTKVGGKERFKVSFPVYAGYSYEVYANPTTGGLGWAALPFALSESAKVDRNIHTVTAEGKLDAYVERPSVKGAYFVTYRVPGANTGTPGTGGGFGGRGPGGPGGPGGFGGPGGPRGRGPGGPPPSR